MGPWRSYNVVEQKSAARRRSDIRAAQAASPWPPEAYPGLLRGMAELLGGRAAIRTGLDWRRGGGETRLSENRGWSAPRSSEEFSVPFRVSAGQHQTDSGCRPERSDVAPCQARQYGAVEMAGPARRYYDFPDFNRFGRLAGLTATPE
jgi:hypothetical protein